MRNIHVKRSMKKTLALGLAAAMVVPGAFFAGDSGVSAEEEIKPVKLITLEKGFEGDGLDQAKIGQTIGWIEAEWTEGQYKGLKKWDLETGMLTGEEKLVNTVLVQGSWVPDEKVGHKGYQQAAIPAGKPAQKLPDISKDDGSYIQLNPAWNQPTAAQDSEKGTVFWLDDTFVNESYPTYATTVDWKNGTWDTNKDTIVKDTNGEYMEFAINNSAAIFDNPFVGSEATGFTFSTWVKNTSEPAAAGKVGDVDGVEGVAAGDALAILKHLVSIISLDETLQYYADVDNDGTVTSNDALDILKYLVGSITEFAKEDTAAGLLGDSEFFHIENRTIGTSYNDVKKVDQIDERNVLEREYVYFSGSGVTYVKDFNDPESACVWKNTELLSAENGGKWMYVSYSFDGEDFHMYINGTEVQLTKKAGANYQNNVMDFVKKADTKTYLGGLGGGVKGNFNTYAIRTSSNIYLDDIAIYTSGLNAEQQATAYNTVKTAFDTEIAREAEVLMTYSFDKTSLAANKLTAVSGADASCLPTVNQTGKKGKAIKLNTSYQSMTGGVVLEENPFAGKSYLTGVTVSYWMAPISSKRGTVTDGVLLSFIDDAHPCEHEKVGSNYLGEASIARSQLYLTEAFTGGFAQGVTKPIGAKSLKNDFKYAPYKYGDPTAIDVWKEDFEGGTYDAWVDFTDSLGDKNGSKWQFVTVTINNAGFKMYLNGELVENKMLDFKGERFCDFYWGRVTEITRKGTNNANARALMDFMTAEDTKAYIGFAFQASSDTNYLTSSTCYFDELSFYDKDMTAEQVKALYNSVK